MPDPRGNHDVPCFFCEPAWEGISRLLGLSQREVQILQCLMLGDDEQECAALLKEKGVGTLQYSKAF